jgi:hypothetical protein
VLEDEDAGSPAIWPSLRKSPVKPGLAKVDGSRARSSAGEHSLHGPAEAGRELYQAAKSSGPNLRGETPFVDMGRAEREVLSPQPPDKPPLISITGSPIPRASRGQDWKAAPLARRTPARGQSKGRPRLRVSGHRRRAACDPRRSHRGFVLDRQAVDDDRGCSELDDLARLRRRTRHLSGRRPEPVAVASRASARSGDRRAYAAVPTIESSGDTRTSSSSSASTSSFGAARAQDVLTRRTPVRGVRCRSHRARRRRGVLRGGGGTFDVGRSVVGRYDDDDCRVRRRVPANSRRTLHKPGGSIDGLRAFSRNPGHRASAEHPTPL